MATDIAGFLTEQYKKLGPVFRIRFAELKLSSADYVLGFDPVPTLSPDKKMKFEIVRLRHPLAA